MPQVFICFSIYIEYRLIVQLKTLKNLMKHILAVVFVLGISITYAQPGGGGGMGGMQQGGGMDQRGGMQQQQVEIPEFNAAQAAGIFKYDAEEAIKKIKIKKNKNLIQGMYFSTTQKCPQPVRRSCCFMVAHHNGITLRI